MIWIIYDVVYCRSCRGCHQQVAQYFLQVNELMLKTKNTATHWQELSELMCYCLQFLLSFGVATLFRMTLCCWCYSGFMYPGYDLWCRQRWQNLPTGPADDLELPANDVDSVVFAEILGKSIRPEFRDGWRHESLGTVRSRICVLQCLSQNMSKSCSAGEPQKFEYSTPIL